MISFSCFASSDDRRSFAKLFLLLHHPQPGRVDQMGGRDEEGRGERRQDRESGAIRISENHSAYQSGQFITIIKYYRPLPPIRTIICGSTLLRGYRSNGVNQLCHLNLSKVAFLPCFNWVAAQYESTAKKLSMI